MPPQLSDGALVLRPHTPDDAEPLYAAVAESVPEVSEWLPWCRPGYSLADTKDFIARAQKAWAEKEHFPFVICDAQDGTLLGGIGINHIIKLNQLGNVGYWVRSSRTGRGIASAAIKLTAAYAFGPVGLTRVEIVCIPGNHASRRVAEKAGARFEAVCRNRVVMHGRPYDAALYSLTPADLIG